MSIIAPTTQQVTITGVSQINTNKLRAAGSLNRIYLGDIGLQPAAYSKIISKVFGNDTQGIMDLLGQLGGTSAVKLLNSHELRWRQGVNVLETGSIVNTVTSAASGLSEIEITVTGPGGVNPATGWYSINQKIKGVSNRMFYVTSYSFDAIGQQKLRLRPMNAQSDLVVNAGPQSADFPNNYRLGDFGVGTNASCYNPSNQRMWNTVERMNKMSIVQKELRRDAFTMQNDWGFSIDIDGLRSVDAYITHQEAMNYYELIADVNYGLLFDQMNANADGPSSGMGLLAQVDPKYKIPLNLAKFSSNPLKYINDIVTQWSAENPGYISQDLMMCMGTAAFSTTQEGIANAGGAASFINFRTQPMSMEEAAKPMVAGRVFDAIYNTLGHRVHIKLINALDNRKLGGQTSLFNENLSIHSHDILILDAGMKRNMNIQTGNMEDMSEQKIGLYGIRNADGTDASFINVAQTGLTDEFGNMRTSGTVPSLDKTTTRHMEQVYMGNIEESSAAVWATLS